MQEIWKPIIGFENEYKISNYGLRHYKERVLKPEVTTDGHYRVVLSNAGYKKRYFVHRLVALTFIPNPNNYPVINHIDGNPANNKVSNLEWTTVQENTLHAYRIGLNDIEKTKEANSIEIIMYDAKMHNVIKTFPSMIECERQTGYAKSTISYHCKNLTIPRKLPVYFRYKEKE